MLNIQRREPDPQELIAVARRYGTVMVARAYADWSRQPEPFKGSLTAAMIDRVDCPAKQRDRIRMGTVHYSSGNPPTGALGSPEVSLSKVQAALQPHPTPGNGLAAHSATQAHYPPSHHKVGPMDGLLTRKHPGNRRSRLLLHSPNSKSISSRKMNLSSKKATKCPIISSVIHPGHFLRIKIPMDNQRLPAR